LVLKKKDLNIIVDSREPWWIQQSIRRFGYKVRTKRLEQGDILIGKAIFERKTIGDFIQSIRNGRLDNELYALQIHSEQNDLIPYLLISGNLEDAFAFYKQRGITVEVKAVLGAIASASVRYGVNVVWNLTSDEELLYVAVKMAEKITEGKFRMPRRLRLRQIHENRKIAHIAAILRVSVRVAEELYKRFGGLKNILLASDEELYVVPGIGKATLKRIREIIG